MHALELGGKTYPLHFGTRALKILEREFGGRLPYVFHLIETHGSAGAAAKAELSLNLGAALFHAGAEGGRVRYATRPQPYSADEIDNLIDDVGGCLDFLAEHLPAILDALKASELYVRLEQKAEQEAAKKKATANPSTAGDATSTGAPSPTPPPVPASVPSDSTSSAQRRSRAKSAPGSGTTTSRPNASA